MKDEKKVSAGRKGGFLRWSKIPKKRRKNIMSAVAKARYNKPDEH
jgi:hypothetical protein